MRIIYNNLHLLSNWGELLLLLTKDWVPTIFITDITATTDSLVEQFNSVRSSREARTRSRAVGDHHVGWPSSLHEGHLYLLHVSKAWPNSNAAEP